MYLYLTLDGSLEGILECGRRNKTHSNFLCKLWEALLLLPGVFPHASCLINLFPSIILHICNSRRENISATDALGWRIWFELPSSKT